MPREDDGLGPNSWETKMSKAWQRDREWPKPGPFHRLGNLLGEYSAGLFITAVIAGLIGLMVYVAVKEQREWNAFAASHDCKVVAKKRGETFSTTSIGPNGQVVICTGSTSDQTAYHCNDGVTYWR